MQLPETAAEATLAIGTASGEPEALAVYGLQLADVRWLQGRRADLVPLLIPVVEQLRATLRIRERSWPWPISKPGEADAARGLLSAELPTLPPTPSDFFWLSALVTWSEVAGRDSRTVRPRRC